MSSLKNRTNFVFTVHTALLGVNSTIPLNEIFATRSVSSDIATVSPASPPLIGSGVSQSRRHRPVRPYTAEVCGVLKTLPNISFQHISIKFPPFYSFTSPIPTITTYQSPTCPLPNTSESPPSLVMASASTSPEPP